MKWNNLVTEAQLQDIREQSKENSVLIFKHSTRCNISRLALDRLERNWKQEEMQNVKPYFLDLLSYRAISDKIAHDFNIEHESPQVLIVRDGKIVYDRSHFDIDYQKIKEALRN
jgi:bacillithiol system protein YtxJ